MQKAGGKKLVYASLPGAELVKKAIEAGDTDLSKNLTKQINQTKADIKGLNPTALKTTHKKTKKVYQNKRC